MDLLFNHKGGIESYESYAVKQAKIEGYDLLQYLKIHYFLLSKKKKERNLGSLDRIAVLTCVIFSLISFHRN